MLCLINLMQHQISKTYLLLDSTTEIWSEAALIYSQVGNDAQIFEIQKKFHNTKQGEMSISQYYVDFNELYQDFQETNVGDAVKFQKFIDKERVYDFLARLNHDFDHIRVQVLGKTPFPSLKEAYSYVQWTNEKKFMSVMLYTTLVEKAGLTISGFQK